MNNNKEKFLKTNKNKIPFKGEAKDFKIKYKTELCKYYEINGYCKYNDKYAYVYGKEKIRSKVTNTIAYRTKKCVQFLSNVFAHMVKDVKFVHQLKIILFNNPYDRGMTHEKILEKVENIKKIN